MVTMGPESLDWADLGHLSATQRASQGPPRLYRCRSFRVPSIRDACPVNLPLQRRIPSWALERLSSERGLALQYTTSVGTCNS